MIFVTHVQRRRLLVLLAALVAILGAGHVSSTHAQTPLPRTGAILRLAPGQTSVSTVIYTPTGAETVVLRSSPIRRTTAPSGDYYLRQCWMSVYTPGLFQMTLYSTFFFDYTRVWQDQPWVSTSAFFPYSWSDISAWNSAWSSTVVFADGQAILHENFPWPNFANWTHHLYIQEDAWGNCTYGGS